MKKQISKVVNTTFRINDLLLKLQDALLMPGEEESRKEVDLEPISETFY